MNRLIHFTVIACALVLTVSAGKASAAEEQSLPIADAHVHYSHDSVELTPPERVIEIMREANLKFALVSSSDDNGTQLLSDLAPDLIIPGLRPYRKRGELSTWFTDPAALEYVETLLQNNRYTTIGEFHINGDNADKDIPRRIVKLAEQYNLILHAHADADAIERLLNQSNKVKILWAHAGFESPDDIAAMLEKHDRLWADLAFRSDVGNGGLSSDWIRLFESHPERMMLGTDTYTPERIYFIPEHAETARTWLKELTPELAERVAWKNAHDLLMPVWSKNRARVTAKTEAAADCSRAASTNGTFIEGNNYDAVLTTDSAIQVSNPFSVILTICGEPISAEDVRIDANMPAHGHGMNYQPELRLLDQSQTGSRFQAEGIVFHMPGNWQWKIDINAKDKRETLVKDIMLQ